MMAIKSMKIAITAISIIAVTASAQFLYPNYMMPKVSTPWADTPYDSVLSKTWQGIKKSLVDDYGTGMVHRPKSNRPGDAVSEGISYGMFLALYVNDQKSFNSIWEAGVRYMWNSGGNYYDWRRDPEGNDYGGFGDNGPASDADQDIALLLIFADRLVAEGIWAPYTGSVSDGYAGHARKILQTIRTFMVAENGALAPGNWGKEAPGTINPGYFAPAFYRIFAEFDQANAAAWNALVESSYDMIAKSPGYARGLLPDWFRFDGSSTGGAGYNAYFNGDALYRDAIRIYWRLATDYIWYGEPRAKEFLDNAMKFMEDTLGGPAYANFFDMDGNLFPEEHVELLAFGSDQQRPRSRREHSHLTLGMWAAAAMGSGGPALARKYSDALLGFYEPGTTYWGHAVDPTGGRAIENAVAIHPTNIYAGPIELGSIEVFEDTLHNEMYFDQFLAWFGASILAGNFTNVWEDLKGGVPEGPPSWKTRPVLSHFDIDASVEPLRVTAEFDRRANWTVTFTHDTTGQSVSHSGNSGAIDWLWYGVDNNSMFMNQGLYTVTVTAKGLLDPPYSARVWLGRPFSNVPNLMVGNRLLVDDFEDGDIYPYIGKDWSVHTDADRNNGNSTAEITFGTPNRLTWTYALNKPDWQFATLDWNTEELDVRDGVIDTIIIKASSQNAGLKVSLQLLSNDFATGENKYFENWITLNTAPQTLRIPLAADNFEQREYGDGPGGKEFSNTLAKLTGIRFHVQYDPGNPETQHFSGAIVLDSVLFAGRNLSRLYTYDDPPPYIPVPDGLELNVRHSVAQNNKYSIRRSAGLTRITLPKSMAGAAAVVVDIRGRTVRRANVSADGRLDISTRGLAAGVYFVEIRKTGVSSVKLPLRLTR